MDKKELFANITLTSKEIKEELYKKHELDLERFNYLSVKLQKYIEEYYKLNLADIYEVL